MTDPPVIHRDIKASNVLITEKLRAKVADFGFARLTTECSDATHISTQVKGTTGYLDPEYLRTYQLTEKSDVYSFGVLLVELMTGRHPIEQKRSLKERVTIKWVRIGASPDISSLDMTSYELTPGYLYTLQTFCHQEFRNGSICSQGHQGVIHSISRGNMDSLF